ncbi:MAG: hypothetical protein IKX88_13735, partial [Thermoguttaceae bacterium]|nr:hypothetical protein [Thermoguttaceae bacterium]
MKNGSIVRRPINSFPSLPLEKNMTRRFFQHIVVALVVSVAAFVLPSQGAEPQIDVDFPGGNVVVDSISDDGLVKVR